MTKAFVLISWGGEGVTPFVAGDEGTESGDACVVGCKDVLVMAVLYNREPPVPVVLEEVVKAEAEAPLPERIWWCRLR